MTRTLLKSAFVTLLALPASALCDLAASRILDAQLKRGAPIQGELIQLEAGGDSFVAIYREHRDAEARGGVILLHDQGSTMDSYEIIRPLRLGLARSGWDTLSLQLPAADRSEDADTWRSRQTPIQARLQAGLDWLENRKPVNRVVITLGDSDSIALSLAATKAPEQLQALVMVSSTIKADEIRETLATAQKLGLPILDIYAERDRRPVSATAAARKDAAAAAGYEGYRQRVLSGAVAGFRSQEDSLLAAIRAWLALNTAAAATTVAP